MVGNLNLNVYFIWFMKDECFFLLDVDGEN